MKDFKKLLEQFESQILFLNGGHTHFTDFRYFPRNHWWQSKLPPFLVTTSFSPINDNYPGYTVLTIEDGVPRDLNMTFLNLEETYEHYGVPGNVTFNHVNFA